MLLYEHGRTQSLVERMIALSTFIRTLAIFAATVLLAAFFGLFSIFILGELWWLGAPVGALIGFTIGLGLSSITTVMIEWLAQMLVAQGEILAELKRRG